MASVKKSRLGAGGSSPGGLNFVLQRLVFVSSQHGTSFIPLLWLLRFPGGLKLLENLWARVFGAVVPDGALVLVSALNMKQLMCLLITPIVCNVLRSYTTLVKVKVK